MLLCPPTYFRVAYSINPWMQGALVNVSKAYRQWDNLKLLLSELGVQTQEMPAHPEWPDLVFTANAGIVHDGKVVLSNFAHPERWGEKWLYNEWFITHGYEVYELPPHSVFEGRGDCFVIGDRLIGGYGFRTEKSSLKLAATILDLKLKTLKLKDPRFYHLDTCLAPIDDKVGIYYPGAFTLFSSPARATGLDLIPVDEDEATNFACNCVAIDGNVIMQEGNPKITAELRSRGYNVIEVDLSEFMKSGGNCRCLVLELSS